MIRRSTFWPRRCSLARRIARKRAASAARLVPEAAASIAIGRASRSPTRRYRDRGVRRVAQIRECLTSGDVVKMSDESAKLIAYYRNNVLHRFTPPLVACAFIGNSILRTEDIQRLAWRIYVARAFPALAGRRASEGGTVSAALADLRCCSKRGPAVWMRPPPDSPATMQLSCFPRPRSRPSALLPRDRCCSRPAAGDGAEDAGAPVPSRGPANEHALRIQLARFFDRSLFENFIDLLRTLCPEGGEGGNLEFDEC